MLHNISILCPIIATFVNNCYAVPARMFLIAGKEICSNEGTTHGDPTVMAAYAIGVTEVIIWSDSYAKSQSRRSCVCWRLHRSGKNVQNKMFLERNYVMWSQIQIFSKSRKIIPHCKRYSSGQCKWTILKYRNPSNVYRTTTPWSRHRQVAKRLKKIMSIVKSMI